jgi:hypothetical protein
LNIIAVGWTDAYHRFIQCLRPLRQSLTILCQWTTGRPTMPITGSSAHPTPLSSLLHLWQSSNVSRNWTIDSCDDAFFVVSFVSSTCHNIEPAGKPSRSRPSIFSDTSSASRGRRPGGERVERVAAPPRMRSPGKRIAPSWLGPPGVSGCLSTSSLCCSVAVKPADCGGCSIILKPDWNLA